MLSFSRVLVAALTVVALHSVAVSQDASDVEKKVDALVAKQVHADGPGVAVAVVMSGEVVLRKGYGLASIESKTAIGRDTLFDLASCTKAFTATAVLLLAERGALSLDDPVVKHLPELAAKEGKRPLRIEDLLHHTSGLAEYTNHVDQLKTTKQVLEFVAAKRRTKPPGAEFEYCNTNYAFLGLIVERVTKKSLRAVLAAEVLGPLGMKGADVLDATTPPLAKRATGYARSQRGHPPKRVWTQARLDTPGITGDGGVFASLDDLILWDAALTARKLLKPESFARAFSSGKLDSGEETGYGFGWSVGERKGKRLLDHSGGWAGTSTYIGRFVEDGVTVIVLSNDEDLEASELGLAVADLVLK